MPSANGEVLPTLPLRRPMDLHTLVSVYQFQDSAADALIVDILRRLEEWYFQFDLEACLGLLAFLGAYRLNLAVPLWLHLIGDSSSGKTEALMNLLAEVSPDHHLQGELGVNTLLSGLSKGRGNGHMNSLLHRIGPRGMLIFPDFTTFLEADVLTIRTVAGQLRAVFDGHHKREVGNDKKIEWRGNLSLVTALTPSREQAWVGNNPGGERFATLRWRQGENREELALRAIGNSLSHEQKTERYTQVREMVRKLADGDVELGLGELQTPRSPEIDELNAFQIPALASMVAMSRNQPARTDGTASHKLNDESPGRIGQQLVNAARGLAALRRKEEITATELELVRRVAVDTIPAERRWILDAFELSGETEMQPAEIKPWTGYKTEAGLGRALQDMYAVDILAKSGRTYRLSERFADLLRMIGGLN